MGIKHGNKGSTFLGSGVGVNVGGFDAAAISILRWRCHRREEGRTLYAATPNANPRLARDLAVTINDSTC